MWVPRLPIFSRRGLNEDQRYSIPCDLELAHARSPGMKMGAGRQKADHSEGLSVICISLMKGYGEFNPSYKPGEMILRIIFTVNSPQSLVYAQLNCLPPSITSP
jgi:hypothetical protein